MIRPGASSNGEQQKGVALLIVLLMLATLSVIAITMTQTMQRTTARTAATESLEQARWYTFGAEALATNLLATQWMADPARDTLQEDWLQEPVTFPIDNGLISARLRDNTLCFNLNSLVTREEAVLAENPDTRDQFMLLLRELGFDGVAQDAISKSIIDWIDSDSAAGADGAEDGAYGRLDVPYRAGNTLLADMSELRAVMWMTPQLYAALTPYLCVHPRVSPSPININLARPAHAPIILAAFGGLLEPGEVDTLIGQIPAEGFQTIDQLWAVSVFTGKDIPETVKNRFRLYSSWLELETNVNFNQAFILQKSLLEVSNNGAVRVIARKTGPDV